MLNSKLIKSMKKLIYLSSLFWVCMFSCQKENQIPESLQTNSNNKNENWFNKSANAKIDLTVMTKFKEAKPGSKRLIFNAMTPSERLSIWQESLSFFKENAKLTTEQESILNEVQGKLTVDLYTEENTSMREDFLLNYMPKWKEKATKAFSNDELNQILKLPLIVYNNAASNKIFGTDKNGRIYSLKPSCNCTVNNPYDCNSTNGVLKCRDVTCDGSWMGCGDMWLQSCSGLCYRDGKPDPDY